MPIIDRSYYDASQQGRQDAQAFQQNILRQQLAQQDVNQGNRLAALYGDPNATPEQFARQGRSDIANSILNVQQSAHNATEEQVKQFAQQMSIATKYAQQAPPGQTKQFIEKNLPFLAQAYGPEWATASDDQVRAELQGIGAKYGAQAGIAPPVRYTQTAGPRGSVIQTNPENNQQTQVVGPDNSQTPPGGQPPSGYRWTRAGGLEPIPGGPTDPTTGKGKITDNERLSAAYATRMRKAADEITALNYVPSTTDMVLFNRMLGGPGVMQSTANKFLSPQAQQYLQAVQDFNRAKLRKESGAAIGKEEVFGDLSTFFPVPGDDAKTLEQKAAARETAIQGMIGAAGGAYKAPESNSQKAPPEAEAYLKQHPELKEQFKAKYGYLPGG